MLRAIAIVAVLSACGGPSRPVAAPVDPKPVDPIATPVGDAPPEGDDVTILRTSIQRIDPTNPRSVEAAIQAIEKAGATKQAALLPDLAALLAKPVDKHLLAAQVAATRAIPRLGADPKAAVEALATPVMRRIPKPTPANTEEVNMHLAAAGASVNALGQLQDASALPSLLTLMYRAPQLAMQTRRAITACGPAAIVEVRKILRGEHAAIDELIRVEQLDRSCDDTNPTRCEKTSIRDFYASILAGDLGADDPSLATELIRVIEAPALPSYYVDGAPGPTQHRAAFDALRKLGTPTVAAKIRAIFKNGRAELEDRVLAASVYAYVAPATPDRAAIEDLKTIAADNGADDSLRQAAADSASRLGTTNLDIDAMRQLASKYLDASAKKTAEAKKIADPKQAKQSESAATAYLGFARMFQVHLIRIALAQTCKGSETCFAATLQDSLEQLLQRTRFERIVPGVASWSDDHKRDLFHAAVDRSMLEVGKRGGAASNLVDSMLAKVDSDQRIVRQAILLALPKVAPKPCPRCVAKLDEVIASGTGTSSLGEAHLETTIVRNVMRWAK